MPSMARAGPEERGEQRARGCRRLSAARPRRRRSSRNSFMARFVEHRDVFHRPGPSAVLEVRAGARRRACHAAGRSSAGPVGTGSASILLTNMKVGTLYCSPQPGASGVFGCAPRMPSSPGHHQYGVIQHRQHALGLGGEIDVPRRIDEGDRQIAGSDDGGLGEYRDASRPLHRVGVEERIAVIDAGRACESARTGRAALRTAWSCPRPHKPECPRRCAFS